MLDFDAGKYAVFVWPAYAVTAATFVVLIAAGLARARHWRRAVERLERDAELGDGIS
jgi:heme exporter protein D